MVLNRMTISHHHERPSLFNSALNALAKGVWNDPAKRDLDTLDGFAASTPNDIAHESPWTNLKLNRTATPQRKSACARESKGSALGCATTIHLSNQCLNRWHATSCDLQMYPLQLQIVIVGGWGWRWHSPTFFWQLSSLSIWLVRLWLVAFLQLIQCLRQHAATAPCIAKCNVTTCNNSI